jgi:NaMN:DMB phosphoribosyltransferase
MPDNPHDLKNQVIETALARKGMKPWAAIATAAGAFDAVASFGDPMMPSVAGIAKGALESGCRVILAGGTQMTAVALLLRLAGAPLSGLAIGTTSYVMHDRTADLAGLAREASPDIPVFSCDLHLGESAKPGLRAFSQGFVKEGVGAGGASIAAMLKSDRITGYKLMRAAEKEYEASIESRKGYK